MRVGFRGAAAALSLALSLAGARPAAARLDVEDRGPVLDCGNFALRVSNAGILGNPFFDSGRSLDPSFEFPRNSGQELMHHAELWVGAIDPLGRERVSGGPLLEWRPTPAPEDSVIKVSAGRLGAVRDFDDDGDGRVDEEILNGKDDDGDGRVDEDLGLFSQQLLAADYADDRPEALLNPEPNGETHVPLHLAVHQEVFGWSVPGYDGIAGVTFHITNRGSETLHSLHVGLLCDFDSRLHRDATGHLDDRVVHRDYRFSAHDGRSVIYLAEAAFVRDCFTRAGDHVPVVEDGALHSPLPAAAVIGLEHTTDPTAWILPSRARAPRRSAFNYTVYQNGVLPGQGGVPIIDLQRYGALAGTYQVAPERDPADYAVLASCGPFATLAPGQSIDVSYALVAAVNADSIADVMAGAAFLHHGYRLNLLPDSVGRTIKETLDWKNGLTGKTGHEVCWEPPPGVGLYMEPHCSDKFYTYPGVEPQIPNEPVQEVYAPGHCVWTDLDCDPCTGIDGAETIVRWSDPGEVPTGPRLAVTPGDHRVRIDWDNRPEVLLRAGVASSLGLGFIGYRVYRLADWRGRESLLPPGRNWALLGAFGFDTLNSERLLATVTDTTVDYERILYEQRLYAPGRYTLLDRDVLDGFDYAYSVTAVAEKVERFGNVERHIRYESPIATTFAEVVVPHRAAGGARPVWVVPNPFRARADWDRPTVLGDPLTRHVDFMGLPHARATIKIWTVAGDLVAQIDHDGTGGDGQAPWNLVSRNGQEVESGLYLFTVDSALGHEAGRFVVIR